MVAQDITYRDGAVGLRGFLVYDETARDKRPGVLVVHEGLGLNEHAMERARMVAGLGYGAAMKVKVRVDPLEVTFAQPGPLRPTPQLT